MDRLQTWYEHEKDSNDKMIAMIESVPESHRAEARFGRAVDLASHLAACRENWLDRMIAKGEDQGPWWQENTELASLRPRFQNIERRWSEYLTAITEADLARDFEFAGSDGTRYRWSIEGQIIQLVGHAFYHRGQIAMLVDELGGETVDTDFLFWAYQRDSKYGRV